MALPKLVLNRNFVLTTLKGHSIRFEKGVAIAVPPAVYADAIAIGALPEDGAEPNVLVDDVKDRAPTDPSERNPLILAAIEKTVSRNEREDFTAAGSPTVEVISRELGFKVGAKEIAGQWQAYHDKIAAQSDD